MSNNIESTPIDANTTTYLVVEEVAAWRVYEISNGRVTELDRTTRLADSLLMLALSARPGAAPHSAFLIQKGKVVSHGPRDSVAGLLAHVVERHVRDVVSLKEALAAAERRYEAVEIKLRRAVDAKDAMEIKMERAHAAEEDSKVAMVVGLSLAAMFCLLLAGAALATPAAAQDVAYIALSNGETLKVLL